MRTFRNLLSDRRGAMVINVAIGIVVIFGFAVVAIDMSMVQLAKTQLQNAADAAALAGVQFLCRGEPDSAKAEAIRIAGLNDAVQDNAQRPVVINESDVQLSANGDTIIVTTHRTRATGDPVVVHFLRVLDALSDNRADVKATAAAICGVCCLKPFAPPDRWYDANGDGIWNADSGDYYDPVATGYMAEEDIGDTIILYRNDPSAGFKMGWYYPVRFPGSQGADDYREWIAGCPDPSVMMHLGDRLEIEPGGMIGPTKTGLRELMDKDPGAYWVAGADTVAGSCCPDICTENCDLCRGGTSPRIIVVPAFDPTIEVGGPGAPGWVTIVKFLVIFVEGYDKDGNIVGRFMDIEHQGSLYTVRLAR
jgi:hypothetical protein